jgi:hypothetical protein
VEIKTEEILYPHESPDFPNLKESCIKESNSIKLENIGYDDEEDERFLEHLKS